MKKISLGLSFLLAFYGLWGMATAQAKEAKAKQAKANNAESEETEVHPNSQTGGNMSGFTFVVPAKKGGGKQCVVRGDTANFLSNELIEITNVKTQVFREGASDIFITSPKGQFNKTTREVKTDQNVQIQSNEMLITGQGLKWDPAVKKAWIYKNVSVKIFSKPKGMSL